MKLSRYFFLAILLTTASLHLATAQKGGVRGIVKDGKSGEEVIGANILLVPSATSIGTTSEIDGSYELKGLNPGEYSLLTSYIGYETDTTKIQVAADATVEVNVSLYESGIFLNAVMVSAVRKTTTDVAVLSTIRSSMQVVSGLSAETIKRTLDSDASQVVRRIPGVTVIDNRFIVIRGLNERYNSTLLHGVNVPSMEPDVRSFAFDIIPSNIIDQILIYKSPAPELSGDFSGGVVKVSTKSVPDESGIELDISTGYRQGSSLRDFRAETRRSGHWLGINDRANNLSADFPERLGGLSESQIASLGQSLPNNWKETSYGSGLDYKVALTLNYRRDIGEKGMQLGNVTSLQYNNTKTIFNVTNRAFEAYDVVNQESKTRFDFEDTEYGQEIMAGAIHNWALRLDKNNIIELKNLVNYLTSYDFIDRFGVQIAQGFTQNNFAFLNEYRGLYSGQLVGTHRLKNEASSIDWVVGYGYSYNDLPDYRRYRRNVSDPVTRESVLFVPRGQSPDFLGKFYSTMRENLYSGGLNLEHRFNHNKATAFKPVVKAGVLVERRAREFEARNLGYTRGFQFDDALTELGVDELFAPANVNPESGIRLGENFSTSNFFQASNDLLAYYLSLSLPIGSRMVFMGGVRVEDNLQALRSPDRFQEGTNTPPIAPVEIDQLSVLPSATLSYNLNKDMVFKAVYGRTLNRPEFREIAPFGFYDFVFDATVTGYSFLTNATVDNFDIRWEWYPNPRETVSIAFFQKNFQNPIETLYANFGSEQSNFLFRNTESAFARGIEVDVRKSLRGIANSALLNRLSVLANFSLIDSEVVLGEELSTLLRAKDRPLQGQSNYIINTGLFYDDEDRGLQVNLLYNVIGRRILLVGAGAIPDTYEMPRNVVDLSIRKQVSSRIAAKLGIKDLLNQEFLLLQDGNEDGVFDRKNDQIFRRFRPGTVYSIGLTFQL